jgi:hypothetical protein
MFLDNDLLMRKIELLTNAVLQSFRFQPDENPAENAKIEQRAMDELSAMVKKKDYCGAEDRFSEELDENNRVWLKIGARFYSLLNQVQDAELEAHDYSREEVFSGLQDVCDLFGFDGEFFIDAGRAD